MNPNGEPQPGIHQEEVGSPSADTDKKLQEHIAKLSPEDYLRRALDRAVRELPDIDPERLRGSAERISSYFNGKLQGIDGQPLSDSAAEAALASIRLERDDRVNNVLLKLAGSSAEASGQQIKDAALDTMFLGAAFSPDEDSSPWEDHKIKFDPTAKDTSTKIAVPEELFQTPDLANLDMDTKRTDLDPKALQLRGRLHPANLIRGLLRMAGRGRNNMTEPGPSSATIPPGEQPTSDTAAQDKIREELNRGVRPNTDLQPAPTEPAPPMPQAPIAR